MTTFHDLFRQPTRRDGDGFPSIDHRRELLPEAVAGSRRLHLWRPGDPIPDRGRRLLIGVATWSGYDMSLLDLIEESSGGPDRVDVFDMDECPSIEEVGRYIPGLGWFSHTPVVGLWVDGRLVETGAGYDGRQLVARACNLDPAEVEARMNSVLTRF